MRRRSAQAWEIQRDRHILQWCHIGNTGVFQWYQKTYAEGFQTHWISPVMPLEGTGESVSNALAQHAQAQSSHRGSLVVSLGQHWSKQSPGVSPVVFPESTEERLISLICERPAQKVLFQRQVDRLNLAVERQSTFQRLDLYLIYFENLNPFQ